MPEEKKTEEKKPPETKSISGVEIFSVGEWNGDTYTIQDIDNMVSAFEDTKDHVRPYLKLGHDEKQPLLQADGLPSAGWVGRLYRQGEKLVADFTDIPSKIHELIQNKAYRKVSSEVFWNLKIGDKLYKRMLAGVALLGANTPGVMNLKDILAQYGLTDCKEIKCYAENQSDAIVKRYSSEDKITEDDMSEDIKKLQKELEAEKAKVEKYEAKQKETEKKLADEAKAREEAEKKVFAAKLDASISEMEGDKLCTPGMKPYVKALLDCEKKEYTIVGKDKTEKKFTKAELLKETLKLHAAAAEVNFEESSEDGKGEDHKGADAQEKKINEYMKENKVNYSLAYRAVMNES